MGIVDVIAFGAPVAPVAVVDRKSGVAPTPGVVKHHRGQVRAYLR